MSADDSTTIPERWEEITGFTGYRVSTAGRVQTKRHRNGLPAPDWRDLKPVPDGQGYPQVRLYRAGEKPKWFFLSHLVLAAFVGPRPSLDHVARHFLTNDPNDNRVENLRWGTQAQNCQDKERHGTAQRGKQHPRWGKRKAGLTVSGSSGKIPALPTVRPNSAEFGTETRENSAAFKQPKKPFNPLVVGSSPTAFIPGESPDTDGTSDAA